MADMFGAPIGIDAAERTQRENLHVGVNALKTLGEIEQQPAEMRMKEAHARYYGSLADEAAAKARDLQQLQLLDDAVAKARATGVDLTATDAQGVLKAANGRTSLADPLVQLYQYGMKRGMSSRLLAPIAEKAAKIQQEEASAASSQAEQQLRILDAHKKMAERAGSLAQMGLQGPEAYAQMLLMADQEGLSLGNMPTTWGGPAVNRMKEIAAQSMTMKEQIEAQRKQIHEAAQERRWGAASARDAAAVELAKSRRNLIDERLSVLKKNGGAADPAVTDLRKERAAASKALREARDRKEFPPAPVDPASRKVGQNYTAADGTKFLWTTNPATGKPAAQIISAPKAKVSAAATATDLEDDGEDD